MRRNYLFSGAIFFWCLIFFYSCQELSSEPPKIDIISPKSHFVDLSKNMEVEIYLSDDDKLVSFEFWLKSSSGLEYFHDRENTDSRDHILYYNFDMSNSTERDFYMKIEAIDSDGNSKVLKKSFSIEI